MKRSLIFLIIILLTGWVAGAKVELPSILSDNMVLQRESDVNLWGKSEPGSRIRVSVSWDKRKYKTVADESGNWILAVRTPEAGGPYSIEISDGEPVVIGNVLIGDVWICAGQSNMEMPVIGFWGQPVYDSAKAIVYSENEKLVRFATVERQTADYPLEDCTSHWYEPSMKTTPSISAIGYFFAREVSEILHIPIGVISVAWGSARMESFMTKESVIKVEGEEFYNKIKRNKAIQTRPETIFNGMIAPVTKFTSKGFLWDQGAANRSEWRDYAELTVEMVRLWRELWGNEDMPFYNISLTSLPMGKASGTDVPLIMEAQYKAVNMMDNAYIVPLTDVEAGLTPHSPDKQMIGERTAMIALVKTYGLESELVVDPPVVRDVIYDGGTVSVYYDNDCYGLCPRYEPVKGFELAGNDRVFHSAEARLDFKEKCIKVTCKEVPEPVAVRYAFRNRIESNLTNTIGMPALPYRSDDWEDSQSGERNSHKNLACKSVFLNCFPQYLAFRGESRTAYQESYESWSASIGNACGFMRKLVSEELDINPVTAEWSGRYAKEHPEKLMLVHINGEARQVVEYPEVRKRYFPGHWVYMDGSNSASDIAVGDTVIKVNDVAPFTRKGYPDRKTVPMTYLPLQVIIVKVSQDGERQWYDSEYAELKSFDEKNGTITLKRGLYDTTPSSYKAGRAYIAPVSGDLWGKHVMWYYNLSSACPKDRNGKQANELYAEEIVSWYKGGCLKEMQGIAFDVNYFDVSKKGKYWDVDNDGIPDGGWVNDRNVWMEGDVAFLKQLRNSLGNEIIISADAQHPHNQQIPVLLNGMESEGLVQHNDMWRGFSRAVNTHLYWARHTHSPYDYRYVVLKVMGPDNVRSSQMRRFGAAAAFCLGASVTAADEHFLPEDFSAPNSLGKPVGQMLRYARSGMPALSLSGENLASRIRVENGDVSLRDGKVYIRAFGNDRDRELKAIIKDVDIPCGDITIFVNARAVEGRTEYAEKYDIPRIMWVRPDSLPVYEDNAQYNEYYCDLYGLFGSSGDEMSYYFREMPEGRQDIHITVTGKGEMELSGIELFAAPDIIMREFEAGYVFVNPSRMERSVKYTDSFGHDRVVAIPPVDASFVGKNRPSPLRDMEIGKTLSVTDFGAIPDDGKNDWAGINAALAELKKCSLERSEDNIRLVFPKGRYNLLPESQGGHCFNISGCGNFVLEGNGSEIIIDDPQVGFISFSGCDNVIVRNFNVDYSVLPFTQGTIIGKSEDGLTVDFRTDTGFPGLDEKHFRESKTRWGSVFTNDGLMLKPGYPNLIQVFSYEKISDEVFRIKTGKNVIGFLQENDRMAVIARYNGRPTYSVSSCRQISFIGNTNYAGPAGGFNSRSSMMNVIGCSVLKKKGRLISQNADCVHVLPNEAGPWIEGSVFSGQMDDAINVKTALVAISSRISGNLFRISGQVHEGDSLRLYNPREGEMLGWYKVMSVSGAGDSLVDIELDREVPYDIVCGQGKDSDMFFNDCLSNKGFVIKDNEFRNSRRYAMLVQATCGVIEGNRIENTSTGGIVLNNGASWPEGFVPRDVKIEGNELKNCGYDATFLGYNGRFAPIVLRTTVSGKKDGTAKWQGVENITIQNNIIHSSGPAIYMSGARNCHIRNNVVDSALAEPVKMENCSGIKWK